MTALSDYVHIQWLRRPWRACCGTGPEQPGQRLVEVLIADVTATVEPYQTEGGQAFPQEAHLLVTDR